MSKWIVVMKQVNEGCDYTIGCGTRVVMVYGDNNEIAIRSAIVACGMKDEAAGESRYRIDGYGALSAWVAYEVAQEVDLMPLLKSWAAKSDEVENEVLRQKDIKELERLQKKLGVK